MSNHKIVFLSRVVVILPGISFKVRYSKYLMLAWQLHATTRETTYEHSNQQFLLSNSRTSKTVHNQPRLLRKSLYLLGLLFR